MTPIRHRQPKAPLQDRLAMEANRLKDEANKLPHGEMRDAMLRKARQTETASHLDQWISSPGPQAPR